MTQRKKWTAVFLIAVFLLSACSAAFCAAAAQEMCTVTVEIHGLGSVSDGSSGSGTTFSAEYPVGSPVTLTAAPGRDRETVYWCNGETDRIVSFSDTYSFSAGSDLYLYVDFEETQNVAAQKNMHQVVYLSEGDNILYSANVPLGSTAFYEANIASITLYIDGRTWTGWDKTPEEVAAESGRVFVRPTYGNEVSYTVTSIIGDRVSYAQGTFGGNFNLSAPATLNGQPFSYWMVPRDENDPNSRDQIASYNAFYQFIVVMPITLKAVYGEGTASGAVTRVVGDVPNKEASAITFYTERSVTSDYTVVESGILLTKDSSIGNLEDVFVLNSGDSRIRQGKASSTASNGSYYVRIGNWYAVVDGSSGQYYYPLIYTRSYLIVRDSAGNTTTLYSPIHVADYVNDAFVGVIEDNPFEDPFG